MINLDNYTKIQQQLQRQNVKLIAVSKTKPVADILMLYNAGQRAFGENKIQELTEKHPQLPPDIEWHMIGHLQTNKVKYIAPFVHMIHAVDSIKLLSVINKEAAKNNRIIPCLLQIKISKEDTKFGMKPAEAIELLESDDLKLMTNVAIHGLMGMASNTEDNDLVISEFRSLKLFFDKLKKSYFMDNPEFKEISMGMSGDYEFAVREGSTMVRIGSLLFGAR